MYLDQRRSRGRGVLWFFLFILIAPAAIVGAIGARRATPEPEIALTSDVKAVGRKGNVMVSVNEPVRGLTSVKVELIHGTKSRVLDTKTFPALEPWKLWEKGESAYQYQTAVGKDAIEELQQGEITVRVTASGHGNWLGGPKAAEKTLTLPVRLTPPLLVPTATFIYVTQGGCEAVTYEVGESSVKDGVTIGEWFFPGYPLAGGKPTERFAFFAVPYEISSAEYLKLIAEDELGNRSEVKDFHHKLTPKPIGKDTINLDDKFLTKVTTEILAQTPSLQSSGPLIEKYLLINRELRKQNNAFLRDLAKKTRPAFLWKETFVQMPNTAVKGSFADRRTYFYGGKPVDTQDHLGFDLASTERAPVPAANSGAVVYAGYLGIYGNTVVVDHGFGLMSLYAHLSGIDVKEGGEVARGQSVGRTGATGLAGGDHLHFTMLLHGLPVTPIEWFDGHWIRDRLKRKLAASLPWEEAGPQPKGG